MIRLLPEERPMITQYIYSLCAIALDQSKDYLIEGRLSPIAEQAGCRCFAELVTKARTDSTGALKRSIINEITTNETLFFRDMSPFDLLRHKILPELIDRRSKTTQKVPLRVWSAACSTGQEIYSVAMVIAELLGDLSRYNIRLVGTDISDQAVTKASAGVFSHLEVSRGLMDSARARYFVSHPDGWKIRDELRAMVTFRRLNLMEDFSSIGKFDVVFCRNVAIYFNEPDRASLFNRIEQRMEPDGYLIVGSMESLSGLCPQFESKRHLRSVYYQSKLAASNLAAAGSGTPDLMALSRLASSPYAAAPRPVAPTAAVPSLRPVLPLGGRK
ncbi:MAG: protein-glutamate O-methyltransferase CheR [Acidobacteria bacterium]|nr:protein-glutamate O-methyltransferase CheR [Acidobacteriota bacterium]